MSINNVKSERTFLRILHSKVRRKLYHLLIRQLFILLRRITRQRPMPPLLWRHLRKKQQMCSMPDRMQIVYQWNILFCVCQQLFHGTKLLRQSLPAEQDSQRNSMHFLHGLLLDLQSLKFFVLCLQLRVLPAWKQMPESMPQWLGRKLERNQMCHPRTILHRILKGIKNRVLSFLNRSGRHVLLWDCNQMLQQDDSFSYTFMCLVVNNVNRQLGCIHICLIIRLH